MVLPMPTHSPPGFSGVLKLIQKRLTAGLTPETVVNLTLQLGLFWATQIFHQGGLAILSVNVRRPWWAEPTHCKASR